MDADLSNVLRDQYLDLSQSVSRNAHTNKFGISHCLSTSSLIYSFARDSVLTGRELMLIQGQPKTLSLPDLSESVIGQLAGEGMALPCLASVIWCIYLTKQFPMDEDGLDALSARSKPESSRASKRLKRKDANENGWRSEFSHCCAVHFGDEESNVERPANVLDRQVQGYESYIEFALLSDAEFLELADLPEKTKISSAAHKMVNLPNCFGEDQSFRLVSLKGMDLGTIFSVQKVKFYCNVGLSMDELLLQASRQLQEDHAARIFAAAAKEQKDTAMPFTAAQRKNLQEIHTVESLKAKLVKDAARTGADLLKPVETDPPEAASDDDMEDDATVGKKAVVKGLSSRLQKAVEEQTMAKGKQPKRKVGKQPDKKQKEDDADESTAIDSGSLEHPSGLEEVAESMQSIPKCFRSLSIPRILAGEKLMRSVDAAKSVADTLKKEKNYSYRFPERVISACECANALSQNLPALSRRDVQLSVNSLIQQGHTLPLELQLQINKRIFGFLIDDLVEVMKMRSDEKAKKLEPLMSQLMDFMCCWKCAPDQSWSFTNPGFAVVAGELQSTMQDDCVDLSSVLNEEKIAERALKNEASTS
ncbi:unnamed protein product [Symbiodinium sp. CCMP2592]|nr:unnamed protein product [Symbiodinium sp. CCMP2592]